jgi:hypothetical protein
LKRGDDRDELGCAGVEDLNRVACGEKLEVSVYWTWRDDLLLLGAHFVMVIIYQGMPRRLQVSHFWHGQLLIDAQLRSEPISPAFRATAFFINSARLDFCIRSS